MLGVATSSKALAAGGMVPYCRAGVGAIASQSFVNPYLGIEGLTLLEQGLAAARVLERIIENDRGRDLRQVAIVDRDGHTAAYTGDKCIPWAGAVEGSGNVCLGNILVSEDVTKALATQFDLEYVDLDKNVVVPSALELVPESPTNVVEPGAPFGNKRFRDVLTNSFSNTAGEVNFAGGTGVGGLTMVGPFVAVAMKFQAIGSATSTTIDFSTVAPRQTKVLMPGIITVTGTLNGVSFPVVGNAPLSDLFKSGP